MGVSTQDIAVIRARPVTLDPVEEYDSGEHKCVWQVMRLEHKDRASGLKLQFLKLCNILGMPSTCWFHDQITCSTEEKAIAYVEAMSMLPECKGDKWIMYPKALDVAFPLRHVRPKWLYNPLTRQRELLDGYVVEKQSIVEERNRAFNILIAELQKILDHA